MVRHSHEDALSEAGFEAVVDAAARELDGREGDEALLALYCGGRLGMRTGEIIHMTSEWIDREKQMIRIPAHDNCTKGQDGGICGYCRQQAKQKLEYRPELDLDEQFRRRWEPKTEAAARAVPYDFDDEVQGVVEAWFDEHSEVPVSRVTLNRRVDAAAEAAGLGSDNLYPHALRATAGTYHAYRGLEVAPLTSLMGWENLAVAKKYIRLSGGATARALKEVHS